MSVKANQKGFSIAELVIIIFVLGLIGFVAFRLYENARNNGYLSSYKYKISYIEEAEIPVQCSSFKSPSVDGSILQKSISAYEKVGFSQQFISSHFKLRTVKQISPSVSGAPYGVETDFIWEICFGNRAVTTQYDYVPGTQPVTNLVEEIPVGSKIPDVNYLMSYAQGAKLLLQCSKGDNIGHTFQVGLTTPGGTGGNLNSSAQSGSAGIDIYGYGTKNFAKSIYSAPLNMDYSVSLETGKCYKEADTSINPIQD